MLPVLTDTQAEALEALIADGVPWDRWSDAERKDLGIHGRTWNALRADGLLYWDGGGWALAWDEAQDALAAHRGLNPCGTPYEAFRAPDQPTYDEAYVEAFRVSERLAAQGDYSMPAAAWHVRAILNEHKRQAYEEHQRYCDEADELEWENPPPVPWVAIGLALATVGLVGYALARRLIDTR